MKANENSRAVRSIPRYVPTSNRKAVTLSFSLVVWMKSISIALSSVLFICQRPMFVFTPFQCLLTFDECCASKNEIIVHFADRCQRSSESESEREKETNEMAHSIKFYRENVGDVSPIVLVEHATLI
jgi:hypothetical protein